MNQITRQIFLCRPIRCFSAFLAAFLVVAISATAAKAERKPASKKTEPSSAGKRAAETPSSPSSATNDSSSYSTTGRTVNEFLSGRTGELKAKLLKERGGSYESEDCVGLGLLWLINHQQFDGSWRFNHVISPTCQGRCSEAGKHEDVDNAATGLALLALLGYGETPLEGKYRTQVAAGVQYLVIQATSRTTPGDLRGTWASDNRRPMYAQALGTLALSEAYGMTGDAKIRQAVELAVKFIATAQDAGGGWRYQLLEQGGDLSVSGWQIMALESARHSRLDVPKQTINGYWLFLNGLERDKGRQYAYRFDDTAIRPAITATGLLSRIWLRHDIGEPIKYPALDEAISLLISTPPNRTNLYYDYYASQLFLIYEHPKWPEWNARMRDFLVAVQRKDGHFRGSWDAIDSDGSAVGGRLYNTAMAMMILEVYYRYLPLYQIGQK